MPRTFLGGLKLIELILITAIEAKASDIHIEATEKHCLVRYRIDGMLQEFFKLEGIRGGPLFLTEVLSI